MPSELARYGVVPTRWSIEENQHALYLWTDLAVIEIRLTAQQVADFKKQCALLSSYYGRKWKDGMLCIPAKEHNEVEREGGQ